MKSGQISNQNSVTKLGDGCQKYIFFCQVCKVHNRSAADKEDNISLILLTFVSNKPSLKSTHCDYFNNCVTLHNLKEVCVKGFKTQVGHTGLCYK